MIIKHEKAFEEFCKAKGIEDDAKALVREAFMLGVEEGYDECYEENVDTRKFGFDR